MRRGLQMILRWPLLSALLSLFRLLSALLGDGLCDLLSRLTLGTPLALTGWVQLRLSRTWRSPRDNHPVALR